MPHPRVKKTTRLKTNDLTEHMPQQRPSLAHVGHLTSLNNVVDYQSLPRVVDEVKAAVGDTGLNLLVNNAGILEKSATQEPNVPLENLEPQMLRSVLETNAIAPLMLIKALLPLLRVAAAAGGSTGPSRALVVNISSDFGSMGTYIQRPGIYAYRASKAAINMMTKTLAECSEVEGMLSVAVHPGWVSTDMGTAAAPLTPKDSVSQMLGVFTNVKEKDNGLLLCYDGSVLPWARQEGLSHSPPLYRTRWARQEVGFLPATGLDRSVGPPRHWARQECWSSPPLGSTGVLVLPATGLDRSVGPPRHWARQECWSSPPLGSTGVLVLPATGLDRSVGPPRHWARQKSSVALPAPVPHKLGSPGGSTAEAPQ
ncbi:C-factor [Chionoecetes opilio]|uniref:C-factor n=1 Tax=Chionoecetes opilio TaxID=41210 RepID=A0A8J5CQY2_CHIOP|nr:C-factor [Chionoecetes opilio]